MSTRRYEFAIDGSNDCFSQDPELFIGSIREAVTSLNTMATDCNQWLDESGKPLNTVELRSQDNQRTVAIFAPYARVGHRFEDGTVAMKVAWRRC
jgi:hypothetical protein